MWLSRYFHILWISMQVVTKLMLGSELQTPSIENRNKCCYISTVEKIRGRIHRNLLKLNLSSTNTHGIKEKGLIKTSEKATPHYSNLFSFLEYGRYLKDTAEYRRKNKFMRSTLWRMIHDKKLCDISDAEKRIIKEIKRKKGETHKCSKCDEHVSSNVLRAYYDSEMSIAKNEFFSNAANGIAGPKTQMYCEATHHLKTDVRDVVDRKEVLTKICEDFSAAMQPLIFQPIDWDLGNTNIEYDCGDNIKKKLALIGKCAESNDIEVAYFRILAVSGNFEENELAEEISEKFSVIDKRVKNYNLYLMAFDHPDGKVVQVVGTLLVSHRNEEKTYFDADSGYKGLALWDSKSLGSSSP